MRARTPGEGRSMESRYNDGIPIPCGRRAVPPALLLLFLVTAQGPSGIGGGFGPPMRGGGMDGGFRGIRGGHR